MKKQRYGRRSIASIPESESLLVKSSKRIARHQGSYVDKSKPLDKTKLRTERTIRMDMAEQLKEMFTRFEVWKCRT